MVVSKMWPTAQFAAFYGGRLKPYVSDRDRYGSDSNESSEKEIGGMTLALNSEQSTSDRHFFFLRKLYNKMFKKIDLR